MERSCPDCAAPLLPASEPGDRTLVCQTCGGRMMGLAPFERTLDEGVGARLWVTSRDGTPAQTCPYCSRTMQGAPGAEGISVCHLCQEVWIPSGAAGWLTAHEPARAAGPASVGPRECPNCGAPYEPDEMGRCHFCRCQIGAPAPIVLVAAPEPGF